MTTENEPSSRPHRTFDAEVKFPRERLSDWEWLERLEATVRERAEGWHEPHISVSATDHRGQVTASSLAELQGEVDPSRITRISGTARERGLDSSRYILWQFWGFIHQAWIFGDDEAEVQGIAAIIKRLADEPIPESEPDASVPSATESEAPTARWRDHPWIITIVGSLVVGLLLLLAQQLWVAALMQMTRL